MIKRFLIALAVIAGGVGSVHVAHAQQKPADIIKYRKAVMVVQSWNMRPMAAMVKGQQPYDAALFAWYAGVIQSTSFMMPDAFLPGSDKGDTRAKAEIWSDAAKFKQTVDRFNSDASKLVAASKAGTLDAVKGPFGALAKNCGGCHKQFRSK